MCMTPVPTKVADKLAHKNQTIGRGWKDDLLANALSFSYYSLVFPNSKFDP
jgi:hypothetical protein